MLFCLIEKFDQKRFSRLMDRCVFSRVWSAWPWPPSAYNAWHIRAIMLDTRSGMQVYAGRKKIVATQSTRVPRYFFQMRVSTEPSRGFMLTLVFAAWRLQIASALCIPQRWRLSQRRFSSRVCEAISDTNFLRRPRSAQACASRPEIM